MTSSADRFFRKIDDVVAATPHKSALIDEGRNLTFESLRNRVISSSSQLIFSGVTNESVIGISVEDEINHMIISLAAFRCGCPQITLPTHDSLGSRRDLARRVGATHVVCCDQRYGLSGLDTLTADNILSPGTDKTPLDASRGHGILYLCTSGTTGEPNVIPFSETQLIQQAALHGGYRTQRYLQLASVEYNNAKRHRLYSLCNGGTNIIQPSRNSDFPSYFAQKSVTSLWLAPVHSAQLIGMFEGTKLSGTQIRMAGTIIPTKLRSQIRRYLSHDLTVSYGATECGTITATGPTDDHQSDSVGRALPGTTIEIVDANEQPLPPGAAGTIRVKSPGMATHYLDAKSAANKRFRDGWFYPGDRGTLKSNGLLHVHGREDDMIIFNGINIFPTEIEQVLERHSSVRTAAALALPSGIHGQIPVVAVELNNRTVSSEELQQYARERLGLRAPRKVVIMKTGLPRSPQGKILKREIATLFEPVKRKHD